MAKTSIYQTAIVIVVGLNCISLVFHKPIFLWIGTIVGALCFLSPKMGEWVHIFWYKLAKVLNIISSSILFTLIFFLLIFPLNLIRRLFNKRDNLFLIKPETSLFKERNLVYEKSLFNNTW